MSSLVLLARVGLAVVFAVAGAAKVVDLAGSRRAVRAFGVPAGLAGIVGTLLPLTELTVAGSLIVSGPARWGALGALILLSVFVVGIAAALRRGDQPDCHCFGQLHSTPAGWPMVMRNLLFAGVAAVVVVAGPGPSVSTWWGSLSHAQVWLLAGALAAAVLVGQAGLIWWLLRRHGTALIRLRELEGGTAASGAPVLSVGDPAPSFDLPGLAGERVSLPGLLSAGRRVLLVFTDPGCGPCQALLPRLAAWQDAYAGAVTVALISRGPVAENLPAHEKHGLRHVARQAEGEVDARYGVRGTPSAILIGVDGRVVGPLVLGAERIAELAQGFPTEAIAPERQRLGESLAVEFHSPAASDATNRVGPERRSAAAAAAGILALGAAAAPAASAAGNGQRAAAERIAGELGNLIRRIAPETFAASQALAARGSPLPATQSMFRPRRWRHGTAGFATSTRPAPASPEFTAPTRPATQRWTRSACCERRVAMGSWRSPVRPSRDATTTPPNNKPTRAA